MVGGKFGKKDWIYCEGPMRFDKFQSNEWFWGSRLAVKFVFIKTSLKGSLDEYIKAVLVI